MKITVQTFDYFGDGEQRKESIDHLVGSAYAEHYTTQLQLIINYDGVLEYTLSNKDGIGFTFTEVYDFDDFRETTVTFTGETPEEIQQLKGNQFRQNGRGQLAVVILPWIDTSESDPFASWEA